MASLVFLGFSIIAFFFSYGLMWLVVPMTLGAFFSVADTITIMNANWQTAYNTTEGTIRWLVPLIPTVGIFVAIIKIFMVASVRGRE